MSLAVPVVALVGALVVVVVGRLVDRRPRELVKIPLEDKPRQKE